MNSDLAAVAVDEPSTCHVQQHIQVRLEVQTMLEDPKTGDPLQPKMPFRKRKTDAGYDLYAAEEAILIPGRATMVRTGIKIAAPLGFYYTIEGRSSLWMHLALVSWSRWEYKKAGAHAVVSSAESAANTVVILSRSPSATAWDSIT